MKALLSNSLKNLKRSSFALFIAFAYLIFSVLPPQPAQADYAVVTSGPITVSGTTPIQIGPLTGQSSCNVELNGTIVGTTQGLQQGLWVSVKSVQLPDGGTASATVSGPGEFTANCASLTLFRFVPTSGSGTVTVTATGGVGRVLGITGGATSAPVSVQAGTGIAVATPSPGVFVVSNTGVQSLTCSYNIDPCTGSTPSVMLTNAPTVTGNYTSGTYGTAANGASGFIMGNEIGVTNITNYSSGHNVAGVGSTLFGMNDSAIDGIAMDFNFDLGVAGYIASSYYAPYSGQCLAITTNGQFINSGSACGGGATSITAGANVVVATPSPGVYVISATTPSPAPTLTPGNGIAITSNVISNTGVLSLAAGSGVTLATSSPGVYTISATGGGGTVTAVTGTGNIASSGGTTPNITITSAPTFANVIDSALTSGQCVQASTGGLLSVTGSACGSGGGISAVTGTTPIMVSSGATPVVSCPTCTATGKLFGNTSASFVIPAVGSSVAISTNLSATTDEFVPVTISDGTAHVVSGIINMAGGTFTSGAIVQGAAGNTMGTGSWIYTGSETYGTVSSVAGTGNISSTGGTTPTVSITTAPTFANVTDSALTTANCVRASTSGIIQNVGFDCPVTSTAASFVIPAVGATVTVNMFKGTVAFYNQTPLIINDGTNSMTGIVTVGAGVIGTQNYTVQNLGMISGAVGNTMANTAYVSVGGGGGSLNTNYKAGTRLNGMHAESNPSITVAGVSTATFTFAVPYISAPTCMVTTVGAIVPVMSINANPTTTSAIIYNSSATSASAAITCTGW